MGLCKNDVTPLLMHWSYVFLAQTHWYDIMKNTQYLQRWYQPFKWEYETYMAPLLCHHIAYWCPHTRWDGGYWANFLCRITFPCFLFQNYRNTVINITFILDRCHHRSAVVTSVKNERDWKDLRGIFAKSITSPAEKLMSGALVLPTPDILSNL